MATDSTTTETAQSPADKKRTLGQVFTPGYIVERILDEVGYTADNDDILHSSVLEPSVGQGVFLQEAVRRAGGLALEKGWEHADIASMLSENIVGIDIDPDVVSTCIDNLDDVVKNTLGVSVPVDWNVIVADALQYQPDKQFDYVVGNPPYVRVHNMPAELRESVKQFESSTGTTDLYIIFFELGLRWLNDDGQLGYIAPNSWLKNHSQRGLRRSLLAGAHVRTIIDYGAVRVFDDADTYAAITVLSKQPNKTLTYQKMRTRVGTDYTVISDYQNHISGAVVVNGEPLVFHRKGMIGSASDGVKLKDICTVQNGVATMLDKVFLDYPANTESEVLRPVVKASRYKGEEISKSIIFPYYEEVQDDGDTVLVPMNENELASYPNLHSHLIANKPVLNLRDLDRSALWFHYGRSQGLRNISKPKLILPALLSPAATSVSVYEVGASVVVYSGLFVTAKDDNDYSLDDIVSILKSSECFDYLWNVGKDMSGGYRSFGARAIQNFMVPSRFVRP